MKRHLVWSGLGMSLVGAGVLTSAWVEPKPPSYSTRPMAQRVTPRQLPKEGGPPVVLIVPKAYHGPLRAYVDKGAPLPETRDGIRIIRFDRRGRVRLPYMLSGFDDIRSVEFEGGTSILNGCRLERTPLDAVALRGEAEIHMQEKGNYWESFIGTFAQDAQGHAESEEGSHEGLGRATSLALSPSGRTLAIGGRLGFLTLSIGSTAKPRYRPTGSGRVKRLEFLGEETLLVHTDGDFRRWNLRSDASTRAYAAPTGESFPHTTEWAFSRPLNRIVAEDQDKDDLRVWSLTDGREIPIPHRLVPSIKVKDDGGGAYPSRISTIHLKPSEYTTADGRTMLALRENRNRQKRLLRIALADLRELADAPLGSNHLFPSLFLSSNGQRLAIVSSNKPVEVWDAQTLKLLRKVNIGAQTRDRVALSSDGSLLAVNGPRVEVWDVHRNRRRTMVRIPRRGKAPWIYSMLFTRDDKRLVLATDDGALIYSVPRGKLLKNITFPEK